MRVVRGHRKRRVYVLQRLEERRQGIPILARPGASAKVREWAAVWRRKWGGKHGRIRVREDIGVPELRQKVAQNIYHRIA